MLGVLIQMPYISFCLGLERLLRDGKAGWMMAPTNEVMRQSVGKSALFGLDALDFW